MIIPSRKRVKLLIPQLNTEDAAKTLLRSGLFTAHDRCRPLALSVPMRSQGPCPAHLDVEQLNIHSKGQPTGLSPPSQARGLYLQTPSNSDLAESPPQSKSSAQLRFIFAQEPRFTAVVKKRQEKGEVYCHGISDAITASPISTSPVNLLLQLQSSAAGIPPTHH
jgi:hypothetical protein